MRTSVVILMVVLLFSATGMACDERGFRGSVTPDHGCVLDHVSIDFDDDILVMEFDLDRDEVVVEITPEYNLYVDGYQVDLDDDQQDLVADFYGQATDLAADAALIGYEGAKIGVAGARIGLQSLSGLLRMLLTSYDEDDFERDMERASARIEARAEKLEKKAEKLEARADHIEIVWSRMCREIPELEDLE